MPLPLTHICQVLTGPVLFSHNAGNNSCCEFTIVITAYSISWLVKFSVLDGIVGQYLCFHKQRITVYDVDATTLVGSHSHSSERKFPKTTYGKLLIATMNSPNLGTYEEK